MGRPYVQVSSISLLFLFIRILWCLVAQSCPILCNPMDCSPLGSSVHEDSPGKNTGVGCHALLQGIFPTQGMDPDLPHCRPPGKPKNTGMGSPFLLQGIFLIQELNQGSPALQADFLPTELPGFSWVNLKETSLIF